MTSTATALKKTDGYHILVVDDNKAHIRLLQEAFRNTQNTPTIFSVQDGVDALEYLYRQGKYAKATVPDLVLLDLNLPRKTGHEVLMEIKSDPHLKVIPIVILSNSRRQEDINNSYALHANCYISKPSNLRALFQVVQQINSFWLDTVSLAI